MADLVNELTWSLGRRDHLRKCPRLYYLRHYEHWNGWNPAAPERKRLAYQLSKMSSVPAYTGIAAHDAIARIAAKIKNGTSDPGVDEAAIRRQMDIIFGASERGEWKRNPKDYPPFFEDLYREGTRPLRQDAKDKAVHAVQSFVAGPVCKALVKNARTFRWLFVDGSRLTSFPIDGINIYCVLDLAVSLNGKAFVFDWKTGRPGESETEQMHLYALFTSAMWDFAPADITARVVYLGSEYPEQVFKFDQAGLDAKRAEIQASIEEMRQLHHVGILGEEQSFPKLEANCAWCEYQMIC